MTFMNGVNTKEKEGNADDNIKMIRSGEPHMCILMSNLRSNLCSAIFAMQSLQFAIGSWARYLGLGTQA